MIYLPQCCYHQWCWPSWFSALKISPIRGYWFAVWLQSFLAFHVYLISWFPKNPVWPQNIHYPHYPNITIQSHSSHNSFGRWFDSKRVLSFTTDAPICFEHVLNIVSQQQPNGNTYWFSTVPTLMTHDLPQHFRNARRITSGGLPWNNGELMVLKFLKAVFLTWRRSQRRSTWRHWALETVGGGKLSQHDLPRCYSSTSNPKRLLLVGHI